MGLGKRRESRQQELWIAADRLARTPRHVFYEKVVGVDSTTLEANAAMKSIVRKDTGESWNEYVTRLMREEGVTGPEEEPTADELRRYDRKRQDKKVSNDEWQNPTIRRPRSRR